MDTTSTAIRSQDFRRYTDDTHRDYWTIEHINHVVDALAGAPVAIIADRGSGFALVGVTLEPAFRSGSAANGRIAIVSPEGHRTNYRLDDIGDTIIPLAATDGEVTPAKWRATAAAMDCETCREQRSQESLRRREREARRVRAGLRPRV